MTFYRIRNLNGFLQAVNACKGGVFFQAGGGRYVDIRNNSLVKSLLEASGGPHGVERLELLAECADDRTALLQYVMAFHNKSTACGGS